MPRGRPGFRNWLYGFPPAGRTPAKGASIGWAGCIYTKTIPRIAGVKKLFGWLVSLPGGRTSLKGASVGLGDV